MKDFILAALPLVALGVAIAVAVVAFFVFGGMELIRRPVQQNRSGEEGQEATGPLTPYQICSFIGMILFIVLALLKYDVGLTAFTIGMVLQIAFRIKSKAALGHRHHDRRRPHLCGPAGKAGRAAGHR